MANDRIPRASRPHTFEQSALVVVAALVYFGLGSFVPRAPAPPAHFAELAGAFLHGELSILVSPEAGWAAVNELIPIVEPAPPSPAQEGRRFYCAYPPLPALVLAPFVAIFGVAVDVVTACRTVSVLNVLLFATCLWRLPARLGVPPFSPTARIALCLLFAFGTVCWHNATEGGDWHLSHAVALAAMLAALREHLARNRPFVVGCLLGLAVLTRPTAALTGLLFALPLIRARAIPQIVKLLAAPALAVFLLALYNQARFGSPTDFGYDRMLLRGTGALLMREYGQFHSHFVPGNAFWFFLAPPWRLADGRLPLLGFDQRGMSVFLATPAFVYAVVACVRGRQRPFIRDAALGIAACLVPLLLYFNTGYAQFGHRFSMDYLPLLLVLTVAGIGTRPSRIAIALIIASIAIQGVGVLAGPIAHLPGWLAPSP